MGKDNINETNKCLNTVKYIAKTVVCSAVALALWAGVIALVKCLNLEITDQNIILTFVGILATFIVISNYEQVQSIEKKTQKQVDDLKEEMEYFKTHITTISQIVERNNLASKIIAELIIRKDYSNLHYLGWLKGDEGNQNELRSLNEEIFEKLVYENEDALIIYVDEGSKIYKETKVKDVNLMKKLLELLYQNRIKSN